MSQPPLEQVDVVLERGERWVFASAVDWPGWSRRGADADAAIDALVSCTERYGRVVGPSFAPGEARIIEEVAGTSTTDFGAIDAIAQDDHRAADHTERDRLTSLLESCWTYLDEAVRNAPAVLAKGPRGGGRDRDDIVAHTQEAERSYGRKIGVKVAPGTPWADQRGALAAALRSGETTGPWPLRYTIRRMAWHVVDHAWEIEDKG